MITSFAIIPRTTLTTVRKAAATASLLPHNAIPATASAVADPNALVPASGYTPSLDFSNVNNSGYLALIAA